jgi:lysozyme
MAKVSVQKKTRSQKAKQKKSSSTLRWLIFAFGCVLVVSFYQFRGQINYYLKPTSVSNYRLDKIAKERITKVLNAHKDRAIGIDVSQFQGSIDWEQTKAVDDGLPLTFVFVRATAGNDKKDHQFDTNWQKAKEHNFIRGAYHYYRPNENSMEQANNFIKTVALNKGDLPPVLDIEQLPKDQSMDSLKKGLKRWLDRVEAHYGIRPIIYSGEKYYTDFLKKEFSDYTFWVANYNDWVGTIKEDWAFWQFTEKAAIPGISERVDLNIYNGTPKMLRYMTINN